MRDDEFDAGMECSSYEDCVKGAVECVLVKLRALIEEEEKTMANLVKASQGADESFKHVVNGYDGYLMHIKKRIKEEIIDEYGAV